METLPAACLLWLLLAGVAPARQQVAYGLELPPAGVGPLRVSMTFEAGDTPPALRLPLWTRHDFRKSEAFRRISNVEAFDAKGKAIGVRAEGEGRWSLRTTAPGRVRVEYQVASPGPLPALEGHANRDSWLVNPSRVLLYLEGGTDRPCTLEVNAPKGWRTVSSLASEGKIFSAPSYERLIDSSLITGNLALREVAAAGVTYRLAIDRQGDASNDDTTALEETVRRMATAAAEIMGAPPFASYLFVFVANLKGARAHPASAVVGLGGVTVPVSSEEVLLEGARAHVQAWNGAAFRPRAWMNGSFDRPAPTRLLWLTEGASDHLATLVLRRANLFTVEQVLERWGDGILTLRNHHLAEAVSAEEASLAAWDEEREPEATLPPRLVGRVLGLFLDIEVRSSPAAGADLPALIAAGIQETRTQGCTPNGFVRLASGLAGRDLKGFLEKHVARPVPPPFDDLLRRAGLRMRWFRWKVRDPQLRGVMQGDRLVVGPLAETSALHVAGLRPGDEIISINQNKVRTPEDVDRVLASLKPGQKLRLDVRHNGKHRGIRLTLEDDVALVIPVRETAGRIVITSVPPGPLLAAGVTPGDVLEKVDSRRITRTADVRESLRRVRRGRLLLTIRRGGKRLKIKVKAPPKEIWRGRLVIDPNADRQAAGIRRALLSMDS